ncbi:MarR family winged helix-turn-helix transcriptional regulator [Marinospirillum sp.]|uniref:MarR family winged helix-turn-helix transcriptional regulator n=1 Tax=Marinospirillum sp. TaxID=2183934 RepID=UPI003A87EAC4
MPLEHSLQRLEWHLWYQWREQARQSEHLELTNSELQYLYTLLAWSETGLRLTELAECMQVSKASASSMTRKLEERGYLYREDCPEDARATLLYPSDKTCQLKEKEPLIYQSAVTHFEQVLSTEELAQLTGLLERACTGLDLGPLVPPSLTQRPYTSP